jgi:hypothetical protein
MSLEENMRAYVALFVVLASVITAAAGEIRKGATMQVKANSIWFEEADKLTEWQKLKKSGDAAALASYEKDMLGEREAWQFTNRLSVKIISYEPKTNHVNVEMKTAGRMAGTTWFIDAGALQ